MGQGTLHISLRPSGKETWENILNTGTLPLELLYPNSFLPCHRATLGSFWPSALSCLDPDVWLAPAWMRCRSMSCPGTVTSAKVAGPSVSNLVIGYSVKSGACPGRPRGGRLPRASPGKQLAHSFIPLKALRDSLGTGKTHKQWSWPWTLSVS